MVVRQPDDHFQVLDLKRPVSRNLRLATITINDSLYEDGAEAKVPANILTELVKTLSYDIDFQRDIHGGDRFDLLYEEQVNDEGRLVRNGGLQYVSYTIDGETKRIYRFNDGDRAEFYLENGEALRRSLMRTPIDGARLSSGFGMRFHPVLGYSRMHRGVDFAAPVGTPIYAAGDGTVAFAGRFSGYGNYVKIKHDSAYQTAYGHMNAFANNIRVGAKVRQGQVIGYVGRTGIATGPHLHYEIYVKNEQVNPLSVKAVGNAKLSGNKLTLFRGQQKDLARTLAELKKLPGQRLALAK
jgi:murein DD-endopeptidase MepM/ murein hydrolase activator NlpD